MKIALLDPFHGGSHAQWSTGYQRQSEHEVRIFSLPGKYWKWRMHGAAIALSQQFQTADFQPDLILATDMMDLSVFMALNREALAGIPVVAYFHENQLAYPWSPTDSDVHLHRDNHYAFINYTTALSADTVFFNSAYNRDSFLAALPGFLKAFPDRRNLETVEMIREKAEVLPLGLDLTGFEGATSVSEGPKIIWNHRWEHDKGPEAFFEGLKAVKAAGIDFQLAVLGEVFGRTPEVFATAQQELEGNIVHWGYAKSRQEYQKWLQWGNLLPVTSRHDFFGVSVVEAMAAGCLPLLPNRLNYPHLAPGELYPEGGFTTRLLEVLQTWPNSYRSLANTVSQYDWATQSSHYDRRFSAFSGR